MRQPGHVLAQAGIAEEQAAATLGRLGLAAARVRHTSPHEVGLIFASDAHRPPGRSASSARFWWLAGLSPVAPARDHLHLHGVRRASLRPLDSPWLCYSPRVSIAFLVVC